jgi:phenylalanyl-tRNA synthetase alpha chain
MDKAILNHLKLNPAIEDSTDFAEKNNFNVEKLDGELKSLLVIKYVELEVKEKQQIIFLQEGKDTLQKGSPEFRVASFLKPSEETKKSDIIAHFGDETFVNLAVGAATSNKWVKPSKATVTRIAAEITDNVQTQLKSVSDNPVVSAHDQKVIASFKKRKLIEVKTIKYYKVTKGASYKEEKVEECGELTAKMLEGDKWKGLVFKKMNVDDLGKRTEQGNFHPLFKVRDHFRQILLELGFEEMPTNCYVESSFWNFDALFQPQAHPARDMHDTFFVKDPDVTTSFPEGYLERVKKVHEVGGYGSIGYNYTWKREEAAKNILRTHTTPCSAKMLYKLSLEKEFKPHKYFSIDRVFRNEAVDVTHLAEFHQVEGLIADRNIGIKHLTGIISEFFKKLGIEKLRFKPTYNPYTEPSMEVYGFNQILKKWVEIGNSGVFRPEMLGPLGLPADVNVIAWGLSLERPSMINYNLGNIRELLGHKVSMKFIKSCPILCMDM